MKETIDQFMWGYQPHFRIGIEVKIERALETIGAYLDPVVFLVGFADDPSAVPFPICIEPETGALQPVHLLGVLPRAEEIYQASEDVRGFHTDPGVHAAVQAEAHRRARGQAIAEAVEASGAMSNKAVITGSGGRVGAFEIHTCLAVRSDLLESLPQLPHVDVHGFPAPPSFVRHLIELVVLEADIALRDPGPSAGAIRRSEDDLIGLAASNLLSGCLYRTKNFDLSTAYRSLNSITSRVYEGAGASGRLLFVSPDHVELEVASRLAARVPLSSTRAVRKLLETTDNSVALLSHEGGIFGFGRLHGSGDSEKVFEVEVTGHATWELRNAAKTLLRVSYGRPTLPKPTFDAGWAADVLARILGKIASIDELITLISAATTARHGTALVISQDAAAEAERLSGQATLLEPAPLTSDMLNRFARIDGAVLIDPAAVCHAVGVILDGAATERGDQARGSRYNSSLRYQASATTPTVVIVVSEDGDVNIIPPLRPQVRRQRVVDAVLRLTSAHDADDPAEFSNAFDEVEAFAFYLSADQCEEINAALKTEEDRREAANEIVMIRNRLRPNPEMNESFFLD